MGQRAGIGSGKAEYVPGRAEHETGRAEHVPGRAEHGPGKAEHVPGKAEHGPGRPGYPAQAGWVRYLYLGYKRWITIATTSKRRDFDVL